MKPTTEVAHERGKPSPARLVIMVFTLISSTVSVDAATEIVPVGAGSYSLRRPDTCDALPIEIYTSGIIRGATPTNQWWSSLVWDTHSHNMFPHPLGMVCHKQGLSIGYPGASIVSSSGNIMGGGISAQSDVLIGLSAIHQFPDARLADHSSWFITAEFATRECRLRASFGHGSPYIFCRYTGGQPRIRCGEKPIVWSQGKQTETLGLTIRGNHYGLFGAKGSRWISGGETEFTNETASDYFSVALLPDDQPTTLALFARYAHNHVVSTKVASSVNRGHIEASYRFITKSQQKSDRVGTIFALYPHQYKYSSVPLNGMEYRSVRGAMKVAEGEGFKTSVPMQGVLPMLPGEGIPNRQRIRDYLTEEAATMPTDIGDTYWEGKLLGKLATLSGIAEAADEAELQRLFLDQIRTRLENWFTASPGESSPLFYYDKNWGSLIGSTSSYGSDSQLNDHHFHYGYFIRAAAEVARVDPEWAAEWGPMVNLLIRDIASPDPDDSMFPYVRCFDMYAGHSWASGHARFGDGNNQESSSESMNAWYALMLWGEVTGEQRTRDMGIFLYNTERTAIEEYWFDVSETNFPDDFPHVALGMIWGGKGAFATWFSGEIDHIHAINWLPFTPATIYLGRFPDYVKKNHSRMIAQRKDRNNYNTSWGDLIVMFNALNDPQSAADYMEATPDCSVESGNARAFMYHWIHTLKQLGINDASVTADYPFVNVYTKNGTKTYAVYNFRDAALKVHFSDRTVVDAAPKSLTVASP